MNIELTKNENEIMDVMWQAKKPLSRGEILTLSVEKSWKDSSIHILLNSLLSKGAIREAGYVRAGRGYGRVFEPTLTSEEYYAGTIANMMKKTDPKVLFSTLFEDEEIDSETINELENLLAKKQKEIQDGRN